MAAFHEGRVERDDVEEGAESQLLLDQAAQGPAGRPDQGRVEEQFAGVVTRLAMDVDGPRVIRGGAVVEPERVGEPGVGLRQRDQLARPRVVQPDLTAPVALVKTRHTRLGGQNVADPRTIGGVGHIKMSHLMIADGERAARERIKDLAERTGSNIHEPGAAEHSVEQDRPVHVAMTVLAEHPDPRAGLLGGVEQRGASGIQLADEPGHVAPGRTETLRVVIQVRQINERKLRPLDREHVGRRAGDPGGAGESGPRSPEGAEREGSERRFQAVGEAVGRAGDPERLVAVGRIVRLGRDAEIDGSALVEPPEKLGRAEFTTALRSDPTRGDVNRLGLDQGVRLLPEPHLAGLSKEPAIAHHAVALGLLAGQDAGLRGAGHGRHDLAQRIAPARFGQFLEPRGQGQQLPGQANRVDDDQRADFRQGLYS